MTCPAACICAICYRGTRPLTGWHPWMRDLYTPTVGAAAQRAQWEAEAAGDEPLPRDEYDPGMEQR